MNHSIRNAWMAAVAMFALLFGAISYVQVIGAGDLNDNPWNQRAVLANYCNDRGAIIVVASQSPSPLPETRPASTSAVTPSRSSSEDHGLLLQDLWVHRA